MSGQSPSDTRIILVYGPTGSGKTRLSIELAEQFWGEVISADSRQIYRGLDIGTGKVTKEEMRWIQHWGLDLIDPDESYNAALFRNYAEQAIANIRNRGKFPIICGWTGLYIDALLYDLDVPPFQSDPARILELESYRQEHGNIALWEILRDIDPAYAAELHPNSYPYVMRGIEVKERTGKSKREFRVKRTLRYDVEAITPYSGNREELYERINLRIAQMFELWLISETKEILRQWFTPNCPGLRTIGYAEVIDHLDGKLSESEALELIRKNNRNYAKRQLTWCARYRTLKHFSELDYPAR